MTYKQARINFYNYLKSQGWSVSRPDLKVLWADSPDGYRLWIKAQSVHIGYTRDLGDARSLFVDLKQHTPEQIVEYARDHAERARGRQ